ncbi:MAG: DUF6062 family protein [Anaerolineae bacterium]
MSRTKGFYDLRDALALSGCPMCRVTRHAVDLYLDGLIYEKVNDPGIRSALREARGFCQRHAWGLVRHGAALGVAIIMRDVIRTLQSTLAEGRFRQGSMFTLARVQETLDSRQPRVATADIVGNLGPQAPCPLCGHELDVEDGLIAAFLENLVGEEGLLDAYTRSDGFCVPHLRQVLARTNDEILFATIAEAQQTIWACLEGSLSEAIRKSDYRFADEAPGEEGTAWLRGIAATAGEGFGSRKHEDAAH